MFNKSMTCMELDKAYRAMCVLYSHMKWMDSIMLRPSMELELLKRLKMPRAINTRERGVFRGRAILFGGRGVSEYGPLTT